MRVCFAGIGSIARRHIRNLRAIAERRGLDLQLDAYRRNPICVDGIDRVFTTLEELPDHYDAIFITNPTQAHMETLEIMHQKGRGFFIEKPLVALNQIEEAKQFALREDKVYYVACPLRYHAVIQYIKSHVRPEDVLAVRSISSSYLPDWRPGQDYRDTYSAHKDLGGGVSIDLIHEWDYLTVLFGWPEHVQSLIGKKSDLEIDSDDFAVYIAEYRDKIVELHLDYFGRASIRQIVLLTKDETIEGDLVNNRIRFLKEGTIIDFKEQRDDYQQRELEHFLDLLSDKNHSADEYYHALSVIELTQGIVPKH